MNPETLNFFLVVFAAGCALALAVQAFLLLRTSRQVRRLSDRLDRQSKRIEGEVEQVAGKLNEIVANLKPLSELSDDLSRDVEEIGERVRKRTEDFNDFAEEVLEIGRKQAAKIDYVVTDTVGKFERTTEVIQRDILRPAAEITAIVKGLRAGLSYLFNRRPPKDAEPQGQEEELFI